MYQSSHYILSRLSQATAKMIVNY